MDKLTVVLAIYSQSSESEASFISDVQSILPSLHEVESTMPGEYWMEFRQSGLLIAGRAFAESLPHVARTGSSLYLGVYQVSYAEQS